MVKSEKKKQIELISNDLDIINKKILDDTAKVKNFLK